METVDLLKVINVLPVSKRMLLIEQTLKSIRKSNFEQEMSIAVEKLFPDDSIDQELTIFSKLDFENFYETR